MLVTNIQNLSTPKSPKAIFTAGFCKRKNSLHLYALSFPKHIPELQTAYKLVSQSNAQYSFHMLKYS